MVFILKRMDAGINSFCGGEIRKAIGKVILGMVG